MNESGKDTPACYCKISEKGSGNPERPGTGLDGPGRPRASSMGMSLRERFASVPGPGGELRTVVERTVPLSPGGISPEGLAWISKSLRAGDVVEVHDGVRGALQEAGATHFAKESGTAQGVTTGHDAPRLTSGAMESPADLPRPDSHGISDCGKPGIARQGGECLQALSGLRERMERHERVDGPAFREIILEIISEVAVLHGRNAGDVLPNIEIEHNHPSARTAFLCGLMIAELVSGCLRHSEAGLPKLHVHIAFRHTGAGKVMFAISRGYGRPPDRARPAFRMIFSEDGPGAR